MGFSLTNVAVQTMSRSGRIQGTGVSPGNELSGRDIIVLALGFCRSCNFSLVFVGANARDRR